MGGEEVGVRELNAGVVNKMSRSGVVKRGQKGGQDNVKKSKRKSSD